MANIVAITATAGFDEKQDALVTVTPTAPGKGITVHLTSKVMRQYGKHLQTLIEETVKKTEVEDVIVDVKDNGAWDYTIKARVQIALERGMNHAE